MGTPTIWLAVAVVGLAVSNGRWIVPAAAWLAPVFMLRFLDTSGRWTGPALGLAASFVVWSFSWQGMIPAPGWLYFMVTGIYAAVYFLPYLAHRLLASGSTAFRSSLVFPTAWVAVDLLFQRFISPYGSWTSPAYTQIDFPPLAQLASLTGTFGVTFVLTWFAATLAWLWRSGVNARNLRLTALAYGIPVVLVVAFGAARPALVELSGPQLRVAAILPDETLQTEFFEAFAALRAGERGDHATATLIAAADRLNADLLTRTRRVADAGADLVAWSETAGRVTRGAAADLIVQGRDIADEHDMVLVLGFGTWDPESTPPMENRMAILVPDSDAVVHYRKARPIVGAESPFMDAGDNTAAVVDTGAGRLAAVICHDLDFPDLVRDAGRRKAQLLLGPSADWPVIADMHAGMASLRAIENGLTLVRPTAGGHTIAVDALGRRAQWTRHDGALVTEIAAARTPTVYSATGDVFAWLCLAAFALLLVNRVLKVAATR